MSQPCGYCLTLSHAVDWIGPWKFKAMDLEYPEFVATHASPHQDLSNHHSSGGVECLNALIGGVSYQMVPKEEIFVPLSNCYVRKQRHITLHITHMFSKDIHRRSGPWLGSWLPLFTRCSQVLGGSTAQVTSAATGSLRTNEATQHPPSRSRSFHLRRFVTLKGSKPGTATTPDMPPKMTGRERGVVEPDSPPDSGDRTALNMVRLTLQALCAISQSVGLPGVNLPFEALLTIFDKIVTVSQNHEGFRSLAQRLQSLRDIFNEISKTRNPPTDLLGGLEEELNKLCKDIQRAMSNNTLEQFINSSDDVLSLAAHDKTIRSMVGTLLLVVNGRTSQKVDELHDRSNDIMAGVNRIESMLSSKERTLLQSVPSQSFRGAKIDTRRVGSDRGGNIGSGNCGSLSQDFSEVEFITGGGAVGSGNANRRALFVACS